MNITITGDIGSGKSTAAKLLSERLGYEIIDTGQLYRKYAAMKNLNVLTQNQSDDWSIDERIDSELVELGKTRDNCIFVSRLAWHFVPDAYKVYLKVNPYTAAKRLLADKRVSEDHKNLHETYMYNLTRKKLELNRYARMYNLSDPSGQTAADAVVHIGENSPDSVCECILYAFNNNIKGFFVDPRVLVPTQCIRDYNDATIEEYESLVSDKLESVEADVEEYCDNLSIIDGHHRVLAQIRKGKTFVVIPTVREGSMLHHPINRWDYEMMTRCDLDDTFKLYEMSKHSRIDYVDGKLNIGEFSVSASAEDVISVMSAIQRLKDANSLRLTLNSGVELELNLLDEVNNISINGVIVIINWHKF